MKILDTFGFVAISEDERVELWRTNHLSLGLVKVSRNRAVGEEIRVGVNRLTTYQVVIEKFDRQGDSSAEITVRFSDSE